MSGQFGWSSYRPLPAAVPVDGASAKELRPGLADVGRLVRRGVRAVVGAARAGERPRLSLILGQHLGPEAGTFDVVEETWPGYDHVNVQAGLDAWLAEPGRTWELVGVANFQHTMFGLGDLVASGAGPHDPMGLTPGNPATVNLACGPDGEVRACLRCGIYLVTQGDVRIALLLRGATPEFGTNVVSVQIVSTDADASARAAAAIRQAVLERNVFRGQVLSFGQGSSGTGRRSCSSTAAR